MHIVLRRSADACLIVPILADHPGGAARCHAVRVVRAGLPLRPCRPSGHSREQEVAGEGTVQEEAVAWVEQFPRGGGLSGACMHPGRVYVLHSYVYTYAFGPQASRMLPGELSSLLLPHSHGPHITSNFLAPDRPNTSGFITAVE